MAQVDDAEDVAVRVGEDDEVGFGRVEVPVDGLSTETDQPLDLGLLFLRRLGEEVQVNARVLLRRRLAIRSAPLNAATSAPLNAATVRREVEGG